MMIGPPAALPKLPSMTSTYITIHSTVKVIRLMDIFSFLNWFDLVDFFPGNKNRSCTSKIVFYMIDAISQTKFNMIDQNSKNLLYKYCINFSKQHDRKTWSKNMMIHDTRQSSLLSLLQSTNKTNVNGAFSNISRTSQRPFWLFLMGGWHPDW